MKTTVGSRPNKYWPIVAGIGVVGLFAYLIFSNQKHSTESGDNIHKFANGGSYRDGSKSISYNRNHPFAYGNASSPGMLLPTMLTIIGIISYLWRTRDSVLGNSGGNNSCGEDCQGECLNGHPRRSLLCDIG
nr:TGB2 [Barley stripe mosaic virus]